MTTPELIKDPEEALAFTASVLTPYANEPVWLIPQSGGKDSRAVAQSALVLIARGAIAPPARIVYMMADTQMEFPTFLDQAKTALRELVQVTRRLGIDSQSYIVQAAPQADYWVRILGYGYAPPSDAMPWCKGNLKVDPMRKMRNALNILAAPVLIGVRYGESQRRDRHLAADRQKAKPTYKILTCSLGGECGPDSLSKSESIEQRVTPILHWRQCAVWDFLTLLAPAELGVSNQGLIDHYGPDGDLRYGCWSCPLIYNDKTAEFLKHKNPVLHELIAWTNTNFRGNGLAWAQENREFFQRQDGRLSLRYCRELYRDLIQIGARHGMELLTKYQQQAIQAAWTYREHLPEAMAGQEINTRLPFFDQVERPASKPLAIYQIKKKSAAVLATANLEDDPYHRCIKRAATILTDLFDQYDWRYLTQVGASTTYWESATPPAHGAVSAHEVNVTERRPNDIHYTRSLALNQGYQ